MSSYSTHCLTFFVLSPLLVSCANTSTQGYACAASGALTSFISTTLLCSGKNALASDCVRSKFEFDKALHELSNEITSGQYQVIQNYKNGSSPLTIAKTKPNRCDPDGQIVLLFTGVDRKEKAIDLPPQLADPKRPPEVVQDMMFGGERHIIMKVRDGSSDRYQVLKLQADGAKYTVDTLIKTDRDAKVEIRPFSDEKGNVGYYTWNPKERDPLLVGWVSSNPNSISQFGRQSALLQKDAPESESKSSKVAANDDRKSNAGSTKQKSKPKTKVETPVVAIDDSTKAAGSSTKPKASSKSEVNKVVKFEEIKVVENTRVNSRGVVIDLNKKS
ncbi:hypothetical protein HQ393_06880 [Chitinibacter bivalviorum]|uniref:Uncharacterized protein n=1 Tax=Chitinibacter bivalviorum TaxID=2739434 RepID=A0A7H9BHB6_9NEIS|nr:hypothetical protein [Chitinibacter bivalviorum]QLG88005.1 hypothetical protein HQ393_06880 [Chitinibacter bivalviorum]